MFLLCQACISFLCLPDPKAKRKTVICFKEASLLVQMEPLLAGARTGEVPGGDFPQAFESVSVETIQETSEIFIFADIYGRVSQFISNG